jgi:hypothetical protein
LRFVSFHSVPGAESTVCLLPTLFPPLSVYPVVCFVCINSFLRVFPCYHC